MMCLSPNKPGKMKEVEVENQPINVETYKSKHKQKQPKWWIQELYIEERKIITSPGWLNDRLNNC